MSTILDALRKAEQERDLGKVPDLRSFHTVTAPAPRRGWLGVAVGVLLINALVLAWLLGRGDIPGEPEHWLAAPAVGPENASSTPTPPALASTPASAPPPVAATSRPPASFPTAVPVEAPVVASLAESDTFQGTEPDLLSMPADVLFNLRDTPTPQPLAAMPESFQRSLPSINLDVHVYSDDPARRFVLINGRRYREGDWTQEGPLVETIVPEGVIMHHQQARFSIPIER